MVEQRIERDFQRRGAVGVGRHRRPQKRCCQRGMVGRVQAHGQPCEVRAGHGALLHWLNGRCVLRLIHVPTGQYPRQIGDVTLCIGLQLVARCVLLHSAIQIELDQAQAKQLHHLARIVFVGCPPCRRVFLQVAFGVEVIAHGRVEGDVFQQLAVVAKRIGHQHIPPCSDRKTAPVEIQTGERHHKKFRQCQRSPLAHRIFGRHELMPDHVVARVAGIEEAGAVTHHVIAALDQPGKSRDASRRAELCRQPAGVALAAYFGDFCVGCRQLRLQQKTGCLCIGDTHHHRRHDDRWRDDRRRYHGWSHDRWRHNWRCYYRRSDDRRCHDGWCHWRHHRCGRFSATTSATACQQAGHCSDGHATTGCRLR